jgi:acylphosphatase
MVSAKILIEGSKVQQTGYRIFLLEKAMKSGIERIYAKNLDKNKVEVLIGDEEEKINNFYETIKRERPKGAIVKDIKKEPYKGDTSIPPIERYLQFLTLEQLSRGREEVIRLPRFVGKSMEMLATSLKGIEGILGNLTERFGIFGQYAKVMDEKLTGMDGKLYGVDERLKGIDEKLDKITVLPEKIDALPERIAEAMNKARKK